MKQRLLLFSFSSVVLLSVGLLIAAPSHAAATITVTTTGDTLDFGDGLCSLREAIISANNDTAYGGCAGGSGADVITFDVGLPYPVTIVLTQTGTNENAALAGDLDINGTLTIDGPGAQLLTLDGNRTDRVFEILSDARVTVHDLTVQHGNPGSADGGGFLIDQTGVLTLTNSLIFSNTAASGGGLKTFGTLRVADTTVQENHGGGVTNEGGWLTLTTVDVISNTGGFGVTNNGGPFTYNTGLVSGNQSGGIYNFSNSAGAELANLTIVHNTGSGISNSGTTFATALVLMNAQIMSNTAATGAGVTNNGDSASLSIYRSRIAYNIATASGGGAWNWGAMSIISSTIDHNTASNGGGIRHNKGNLGLTDDTLSFNAATNNGGGLYVDSEASTLATNVTIDSNHTNGAPDTGGNLYLDNTSLALKNTIVSNSGPEGNCGFNLPAFMNSAGYNLDSGSTCGLAATGDITNTDPLLRPLGDNGGSTPTQALSPISPAIDHGTNTGCPATDQRGVSRPQNLSCDIGAYEIGAFADLAVTKRAQSSLVEQGAVLAYTIVVTNAGPLSAAAVTLTDQLPADVIPGGVIATDWSCATISDTITCTRSVLPLTSTLIVITVTTPLSTVTITNTAALTATTPDWLPGNNSSTVTTRVAKLSYIFLPLILRGGS